MYNSINRKHVPKKVDSPYILKISAASIKKKKASTFQNLIKLITKWKLSLASFSPNAVWWNSQSFLTFGNKSHNKQQLYATAVGICCHDGQITDLLAGFVRPGKETPYIPQSTRPLFYLTTIIFDSRCAYVLSTE
jgi:hypothetical protein